MTPSWRRSPPWADSDWYRQKSKKDDSLGCRPFCFFVLAGSARPVSLFRGGGQGLRRLGAVHGFGLAAEGLQGLCRGTDLVLLTTRGGIYADGDPLEQATPYLRGIQRFFGFDRFQCVAADGLDVDGFDGAASLKAACGQAAELARSL